MKTINNVLIDNLKDEVLDTLPEYVLVTFDFKESIVLGKAKPYLISGKLYADFEISKLPKIPSLYPCIKIMKDNQTSILKLIEISLCQKRNIDETISPIIVKQQSK